MAVALPSRWPSTVAPAGLKRARLRAHLTGHAFLLPWLCGFFGLTLGPALATLYLSFTDFGHELEKLADLSTQREVFRFGHGRVTEDAGAIDGQRRRRADRTVQSVFKAVVQSV